MCIDGAYLSVVDDDDLVVVCGRRESVADGDDGTVPEGVVEGRRDELVGVRVERRCRLVEDHQLTTTTTTTNTEEEVIHRRIIYMH